MPGFVKMDDPSSINSNDGLAYTDKRYYKCETCDRETVISFLINLYREHGLKYIGLYPKIRSYSCAARNIASLVIGPEGELYDCWNDVGNQSKIIGEIGQRISNLKLHLKYIADASQFDDADCLECKLLPVCNGGCPRNRILTKDKVEKKDNCILNKDYLEDFLYMHYLSKNNFNKKTN